MKSKSLLLALACLAFVTLNAAAGNTRTVTSLNDDGGTGTLRYLIGASFDGDTINFSVTGTITLTNGTLGLVIKHSLTIIGPEPTSLTVSGNNASPIFNIAAGTTNSISGLTIANGNGEPVFYYGGGIYNDGILTVNNCILTANTAPFGGGIYNYYHGTLTVNNCTVSANTASYGVTSYGGGICNDRGTLIVNNCTLSANIANYGGGIANINGLGTLTVNNCTVSANTASYEGGGICNDNVSSMKLHNTIIAGNSSSQVYPDVFGTVTSQGHNLVGNTSGSSGWAGSDLLNGNPQLGSLQDNGGPTFTMAPSLNPISAAIDAGDDAVTGTPLYLTTDQRGLPRKSGAHVDIGAYEVNPPSNHIVTVTSDSGVGSLRQAILDADSFDTITFALGGAGTITLTNGQLSVGKNISINGPSNAGVTVSGNNASRVFLLTGGTVSLANLTIANGNTSGPGGGFFSESGSTLILNNCTVSSNVTANSGGGIANNGSVLATNCTFSGNHAAAGGGIFTYAGPVVLQNCTVCYNTSGSDGGGLFDYGIAGSIFTLGSTLVARNNAVATGPDVISNPTDPFISLGYNLIGNGSLGYGLTNAVNHDQVGVADPKIGPLQDNGGPTFTHALLTGSPAIDQGNSPGLATDQRWRARIYNFTGIDNVGDGSDIGAFELQPVSPLLLISYSANQAVVTWSASLTGWTLQTNNNLNTGIWGNYAGAVVNNSVTNSPPKGNLFFRLKQ
jgi:hypothetical protein